MTEPEPCPFCGRPALCRQLTIVDGPPGWDIGCTTGFGLNDICDFAPCAARFPTREAAVEAWNKRTERTP